MTVSFNLRKGTTSFEFWHKHGEDQINVINSMLFIKSKKLVLSCEVNPASSNQRSDANSIFRNPQQLTKIVIADERIFQRFVSYTNNHRNEFDSYQFIINFENLNYPYLVDISKNENDWLILLVQA